jgi:dTDP-4-amino-4,6-dideoxygalactose transaminase
LFWIPASVPALGIGETRYREPSAIAGMASGPCAALVANWRRSKEEAESRRTSGERLRQSIEGTAEVETIEPPAQAVSGWLRFPVVLNRSPTEEAVRAARRLGAARSYPLPLPDLPALRGRMIGPVSSHGASVLAERLWTLPTHTLTSVDEAVLALRRLCRR